MRQDEFFQSFQEALSGEVSEGIIQENITYYKRYIYEETQKGKSMDQVLDSLGNPRLLAKTIINTSVPNTYKEYTYENGRTYESYNGNNSWEDADDHRSFKQKIRELKVPSWLKSLLSVVVIALLIGVAFTVISYLAPFLIIIACIIAIIRIVKNISDGY